MSSTKENDFAADSVNGVPDEKPFFMLLNHNAFPVLIHATLQYSESL